jgi:hypothetical protein
VAGQLRIDAREFLLRSRECLLVLVWPVELLAIAGQVRLLAGSVQLGVQRLEDVIEMRRVRLVLLSGSRSP